MYLADRTNKRILRCAERCTAIAKHPFRDVRWMTVTPDGVVYLIDTTDLLRIQGGKVTTVARNLSANSVLRPWAGDRHKLMGLWTDRAGMVYVADYSQGEVKRIEARGNVTTFTKSPYPWAPTGGAFDANGDLWLLEYRMNAARLRKVAK